jgi:hypothetical protein
MMLLNRDSVIQSASRNSAQFTSQKNQIPCSHSEDVIYRLDTQLSRASSVRTTRSFHPDLPLCREASNCSSLDPSGRFNNTSGQHSVFDQLWDFFPKNRYGKIAATVQTTWNPVWMCSSIRQVLYSKSRPPDVSPLGPDARASDMEIAWIRSTVRKTIPLVRTREALIWKLLAAKVRPSGRQGQHRQDATQIRKEFQGNFGKLIV